MKVLHEERHKCSIAPFYQLHNLLTFMPPLFIATYRPRDSERHCKSPKKIRLGRPQPPGMPEILGSHLVPYNISSSTDARL
jgi:hypothetical protein